MGRQSERQPHSACIRPPAPKHPWANFGMARPQRGAAHHGTSLHRSTRAAHLRASVVPSRATRTNANARKVARAILPVTSALSTGRIARTTARLLTTHRHSLACLAHLRALRGVVEANVVRDQIFEFYVVTFNQNRTPMRVLLNKNVGYEASLRQKASSAKAEARWYSTNVFPIMLLKYSTKLFLIKEFSPTTTPPAITDEP